MRRSDAQIPRLRRRSLLHVSGTGETIRLEGEVDLFNVEVLRRVLDRERARGGDVTLDLGALTFIDLAGMRTLHRAALAAGRAGRTLTLLAPPPLLAELLVLLELDAPTSMRIAGAEAANGGAGRRGPPTADPAPPAYRRPLVARVARMLAARADHRLGRPARAR